MIFFFFTSSKVSGSEPTAVAASVTLCHFTCLTIRLSLQITLFFSLSNHYLKFTVGKILQLLIERLPFRFRHFSSELNEILAFYMQTRQLGGTFRSIYSKLWGWSDCSCLCIKFQDDWDDGSRCTLGFINLMKRRCMHAFCFVCTYNFTPENEFFTSSPWNHIQICFNPQPFTDRRRAQWLLFNFWDVHSCLSTWLQQPSAEVNYSRLC